uniref:6-cysteine protein n=1 Tax=Parastrongyloides trichosuri TaxID=131310 RepID=A0A0N4ZDM7_PARTI
MNKVISSRFDIINAFINIYVEKEKSFDISKLCIYNQNEKYVTESLTGNTVIFLFCGYKKVEDLTIQPYIKSPNKSQEVAVCASFDKELHCSEGFCGMYQREIYDVTNQTLLKERKFMCPHQIIGFLYTEMESFNSYQNFNISIKNAARKLKSDCSISKDYYFHGDLRKYNNDSNIKCKSENDYCVYISLNIPALAIGSFHSCSKDVSSMLTEIFDSRLDLIEMFSNYKNELTNIFDADYFCKYHNNTLYSNESITGTLKIFTYCHSQKVDYDLTKMIIFNPPSFSATPVQCSTGDKWNNCSEGYCSIFQVSYITEPLNFQQHITEYGCPYQIYNVLTDLQQDSFLYSSIRNDMYKLGETCAKITQLQKTVINGTHTYYLYINCYEPSKVGVQIPPDIPKLNGTNNHSTNSNPTDNKALRSNSLNNIINILLLILTLFK